MGGKVFIATDMEGIALVRRWCDVDIRDSSHAKFARVQSLELLSIIDGLGPADFSIRDAHDTGANLLPELFPDNVKLLLKWRGISEFGMLSSLDKSFDFCVLHGFHAAAGTELSTLAHTFHVGRVKEIRLNGRVVGETTFALYTSAYIGVPVVMVSGDSGAVGEATYINPNIVTVVAKTCRDGKVWDMLTERKVRNLLELSSARAAERFKAAPHDFKITLPMEFALSITYTQPRRASVVSRRLQKFPRVTQVSEDSVEYKSKDFPELLRMLNYLVFMGKLPV